ncbi:flagellar export chaperone FliS [Thalassotalea ganghwensis]
MRKNLKAYNQVNIDSTLMAADPHQVILMMYDGLLESIAKVKGAIERKDLAVKSQMITKAVNILSALDNALDAEAEPKISETFSSLYQYCIQRLNDTNITLEVAALDEVTNLLKPIRDAWREIPEDAKQEGFELLKKKDQQSAVGA